MAVHARRQAGTPKSQPAERRSDCRGCGVPIIQQGRGRSRVYCSARCNKYGVGDAQFYQMLEERGWRCDVCRIGVVEKLGATMACLDHDHETGRVRGILCSNCNTGLGLFQDNAGRLLDAIAYLEANEGKSDKGD